MTVHAISDITGLPALPEGAWWRVEHVIDGINAHYLYVSIVHEVPKLTWWSKKPHKTKKVVSRVTKRSYEKRYWSEYVESHNPKVMVKRLAEMAYADYLEDLRVNSQESLVTDLLGDYPPKSLND